MNNFDERLATAFIYIQEFQYAYLKLVEWEQKGVPTHSTPIRTYVNLLYIYISAWFVSKGGFLKVALQGAGFDSHLDAIDQLLQKPVGNATVADVVRVFRHKYLIHNTQFSPRYVEEEIKKKTGIDWDDCRDDFWPHFLKISYEIQELGKAIQSEEDTKYFTIISSDNPRILAEMQKTYNVTVPVLYDHRRAYLSQYNIFTFPFNITIDKNGVVLDMLAGTMSAEDFREIIEYNQKR